MVSINSKSIIPNRLQHRPPERLEELAANTRRMAHEHLLACISWMIWQKCCRGSRVTPAVTHSLPYQLRGVATGKGANSALTCRSAGFPATAGCGSYPSQTLCARPC